MVKCPYKLDWSRFDSKGVTGFMSAPVVSDINGYDILFAGLPYECDSSAKPGSKNGAAYFRRDIFGFGVCDQGVDIDMSQSVSSADCGDLIIDDSSEEAALNDIYKAESAMLSTGAVPFIIGGDELTAYAQIKACYEKYGRLSVLCFGGSISAALIRAASEGMCLVGSSAAIGVRNGFAKYKKSLSELSVRVMTASDADYAGICEYGKQIADMVKGTPVMVVFDVNFYDPACVTAAAKPYAGGFLSHETVTILETALMGADIKAISVCGMLDSNDPGETSLNNLAEAANKLYAIAAYDLCL